MNGKTIKGREEIELIPPIFGACRGKKGTHVARPTRAGLACMHDSTCPCVPSCSFFVEMIPKPRVEKVLEELRRAIPLPETEKGWAYVQALEDIRKELGMEAKHGRL